MKRLVVFQSETGFTAKYAAWIAEELSVSRAAVWKAIDLLRKSGHEIEAVNHRGYRLKSESDPASFFLRLQSELKKETGLSCSIGVAPTKWLAKMASDLRKPMGMTILRRKDIPLLLYPLPIESFWGIGKKTSPRLREMGIQTIGDFAQKAEAGDPALRKELGKFFATAKEWIEGGGSDQVSISSEDPKSIGAQETLPHDCREFEEVAPYFAGIAEAISSRAKKERKEFLPPQT